MSRTESVPYRTDVIAQATNFRAFPLPPVLQRVLAGLLPVAALCAAAFPTQAVHGEAPLQDASNSENAELIETLKANWDGQRSAIATAHFRARGFRSGTMEPLDHARVSAVFESVDLVRRPDDLRAVVAAICKDKKFSTPNPWGTVELTMDGARLREKSALSAAGMNDNVVDAGLVVLGRTDIKQVGIIRQSESRWHLHSLDDFRLLPDVGDQGTLIVARRDAKRGRVVLADWQPPSTELEVDEATGFVHWLRKYVDGAVIAETLQYGPALYPGDLVLPAVTARLQYDASGTLINAHILVVEECSINSDLPADAFVISAPKGTLIADSRNPQRARRFRARSDIADVVAAFPLNGSASGLATAPSNRRALLAAAGLLAAVLVVVALYRHYQKPAKHGET